MMAIVGSVIVAATILWAIGLSFVVLGAILDAMFGDRILASQPRPRRAGWHLLRHRSRA